MDSNDSELCVETRDGVALLTMNRPERLNALSRAMLDGAAFRVWRAEIEPADAGEGDGRGAHGAGFKRDMEIAAGEPLAAELGAGLSDGE